MRIRTALLALSLALPAPSAAAADACPTDVTTPQAPTRARPRAVERLMSAKPDPDVRVLVVGASGVVRWPKHLRDEAFGAPSFRFALGGDQIQQVLWRLDRADFSGARFDRVILTAGGNNFRNRACEISAGIEAATAKLRAMFPEARITVLSLFPRGRNLAQGRSFEEANRLIRASTQAAGHQYVDAYSVFRERCGFDDTCPLYADPVHLSDEGYRLLGDLLKNRSGIDVPNRDDPH